MATVAFRLFGSLELGTAQMEQRLTAVGTSLERMTRQQVIAHRAVGQLRSGMQGLAFEAVGATGAVGQFAVGALGALAGPAMFAGLAALAALALAFRSVTKAGKEAEEGEQAARGITQLRIARLQRFAGPLPEDAGAQRTHLVALEQRRRALEAQQETLFGIDTGGRPTATNIVHARLVELQREIDGLTDRIRRLNDELGRGALRTLPAGIPALSFTSPLGVPLRGVPPRMTLAGGAIDTSAANETTFGAVGEQVMRLAQTETARLDTIALLADAEQRAALVALSSAAAVNEFERSLKSTQTAATQTAIVLIQSFASLTAGIIGGGSPGGILSTIGGGLGFIGTLGKGIPGLQIAGAIVGGFGSIITASEARREAAEERRHRETLEAMRERPPVFIYPDDVSDSGMHNQSVRYNRYIGRGGRGFTQPTRGGGLSRP